MKTISTHRRSLFTGFVAAALIMVGGVTAAHASTTDDTIVGATPNTSFANSSVTFSFGDATYTFSNHDNALYVQTGGSAQVTLLGGSIPNSPHKPDGIGGAGNTLPDYQNILGTATYAFDSFPTSTEAPTFQFYGPYIGLKFLLDGQTHYGYADIADLNTLVSYAYNATPGAGITTGQAITAGPTPVPEPSSLGIFGLGLGLVGFIGLAAGRVSRRYKTRSNREPQMA